ncbi:MAG TPA: N-acetylmuramoyl-L-alanine amidase [Methyloceanibacter sp.]|jgi:N-acetylmuramoyl-L-alanine amidase|nr:N-acetylmuramoyl-L-alanine amidase [Methyloceanibacter sp.]
MRIGAARGLACAVFLVTSACIGSLAHAEAKAIIAQDARVAGDRERTRFIADLSKKVDVHVFALASPYRVIVDAPDVNFQMPEGVGKEKRGLITAYRYGLFAPGKSRIVIDVGGPFLIDKAFVLEPRDDQPARLVVDLVPTDEKTFQAKLKETRPPEQASAASMTLPEPPVRAPDAKPVIVLDPGHGGIDPGTSSADGVTEKDVVLAFAKSLKAKLEATGRYEVYLTREDDTFLPLRERVEFAQKKGAGLFLSIHADYFPQQTEKATGATVYTLSEQASDEEAKELATKENFSDALAGVALPSDSDEVVANILIDLAQRETQNRSSVFARSIVGELAGNLHTRKLRSAGFRVLKAPDVPSVLLEIGFLSNPDDEKHLVSDAWRDRMGNSLVEAIDGYFAKRVARAPF